MQTITASQVSRLLYQGFVYQEEEHVACKKHKIQDKRGICYPQETTSSCIFCASGGAFCYSYKVPLQLILDRRSAKYLMPRVFQRYEEADTDSMEEDGIEFVSATPLGWRINVPLCINRMQNLIGELTTQRAVWANTRLPVAVEIRRLAIHKYLPSVVIFGIWRYLYGPRPICIFCCCT